MFLTLFLQPLVCTSQVQPSRNKTARFQILDIMLESVVLIPIQTI